MAMGVEHAPKTFAHRVGSYKDNKIGVLGTNKGHSNFIGRINGSNSWLTSGVNSGTISAMAQIEKILEMMRREPGNVSFNDFKKVCVSYFGKPRQDGSSHAIFKTPWPGDPRVNIQNAKGKAKPYQVRQVLQAIEKLGSPS
jgi:hypothetical protein